MQYIVGADFIVCFSYSTMIESSSEKRDHRLSKITKIWERIAGIPSTSRDAEYYREALFPDCANQEELLKYLENKVVVDIGSGLTHENPYSLINVAAREKKSNILFLGIDPKVEGAAQKFSPFDRLGLLWYKLRSKNTESFKDTPGQKMAIAAQVPGLPLPDKSVDVILSSAVIGTWITDPQKLLEIFKDFNEVLCEKGEIRINSFFPKMFEEQNELGNYLREHFTIDSPGNSLVILRKKY